MSGALDLASTIPQLPSVWQPGERVGPYVVRSLIGRGGMGGVWEAWDPELQRAVALKSIEAPDCGDDVLVNEARALAAVRHPGLPTVHGLGTHRGRRYLVLERLYGGTVERTLRQRGGGLDVLEALGVLIDVARILHAVHQAGMVHHDVKPSNVMLCQEQRTVLLDFGIMLPAVRAATAERMGTPGYLAPEVLLDAVSPERAARIDVYAFGALAYEMLTGRPPFRGASLKSVLRNCLSAPPPELCAARPDLPPRLDELVRTCMAQKPDDRPADMEQVAGELSQIRRHLDRRRPPPPAADTPARAPRRTTGRQPVAKDVVLSPTQPRPSILVVGEPDVAQRRATDLRLRGYASWIVTSPAQFAWLWNEAHIRPSLVLVDVSSPVAERASLITSLASLAERASLPTLLVGALPVESRQFVDVIASLPPGAAMDAVLAAIATT